MTSVFSSLTEQNEHSDRLVKRILFCPTEERTARELQQLPRDQREQVWADMTGHAGALEYRMNAESAEFLKERIEALTLQLSRSAHSSSSGAALEIAINQDPLYVHAQKVKFLRADDFDETLAAVRMTHHFQAKQDLFGNDLLGRDITLADMTPDDLESLKAGGMQCLPLQDHASRGVIFTRTLNYVYKERKNILRAFFYVGQQVVKNNDHFQKVGFISVSYQVGGYPKEGYDFELTRKVSQLVKSMPLRFVAIYVCFASDSPWKRVADLISHLVSPLLRVRLRTVQGSHQECLYKLMALGVCPDHAIPVNNEGESLLTNHWKWVQSQWHQENPDLQKIA